MRPVLPPGRPDEVEAELARRSLSWFLQRMMPGYTQAPHQALICRTLEQLERGEITRLMVLMPPRHGKTLHLAHAFPAWYLGRHPTRKIISASYGAELAEQNSRATQAFIADPRYPFTTTIAANLAGVEHWQLHEGGAYRAAGVGGGITGFGADVLISTTSSKAAPRPTRSSTATEPGSGTPTSHSPGSPQTDASCLR